MRNIAAHPVTKEEIVACLKQFGDECDPMKTRLVGDMRPFLLAEAIRVVEESNYEMKL